MQHDKVRATGAADLTKDVPLAAKTLLTPLLREFCREVKCYEDFARTCTGKPMKQPHFFTESNEGGGGYMLLHLGTSGNPLPMNLMRHKKRGPEGPRF
jgi:hypothetical protein